MLSATAYGLVLLDDRLGDSAPRGNFDAVAAGPLAELHEVVVTFRVAPLLLGVDALRRAGRAPPVVRRAAFTYGSIALRSAAAFLRLRSIS